MDETRLLERLETEEIVVTGRLVDASNATLFGHLGNDKSLKVIYKPVAGERPLWDFPDGSLAHREYAAFLFSEFFDFNIVPATVLRDGPFGFGMVQLWISDAQTEELIDVAQSERIELRKMVIFDALINNADRKFGHILIPKDSVILGCDHGVSFHVEDKLRTVLWQFAGEELLPDEIALVKKVESSDLFQFKDYLLESEIAAIHQRARDLLQGNTLPHPAQDRPAIPWPPV
jgi:uncharacterized repeat protein (TIGR03843 family)